MLRSSFSARVLLFSSVTLGFVGCNGNVGSGSESLKLLTCTNPPALGPLSDACNACQSRECASQFAAAVSACTVLTQCLKACDCADKQCLNKCGPTQDSTCNAAASAGSPCELSRCADPCTFEFDAGTHRRERARHPLHWPAAQAGVAFDARGER